MISGKSERSTRIESQSEGIRQKKKRCFKASQRDLLWSLDDGQTRESVGETFAELGNLVVHSKRDVTNVTPS
jgi:hypothetical protein